MRYHNQLPEEKLALYNLSKMNQTEISAALTEDSDSMESVVETNNNSTMSDKFNWNVRKPDLELTKTTKSFAVVCDGESENDENREFNQAPSSRFVS